VVRDAWCAHKGGRGLAVRRPIGVRIIVFRERKVCGIACGWMTGLG
jgi:hypothetical protein